MNEKVVDLKLFRGRVTVLATKVLFLVSVSFGELESDCNERGPYVIILLYSATFARRPEKKKFLTEISIPFLVKMTLIGKLFSAAIHYFRNSSSYLSSVSSRRSILRKKGAALVVTMIYSTF